MALWDGSGGLVAMFRPMHTDTSSALCVRQPVARSRSFYCSKTLEKTLIQGMWYKLNLEHKVADQSKITKEKKGGRYIGQVMVKRLTGADACSLNHLQMQTSTLSTKFESRILLKNSPDEWVSQQSKSRLSYRYWMSLWSRWSGGCFLHHRREKCQGQPQLNP